MVRDREAFAPRARPSLTARSTMSLLDPGLRVVVRARRCHSQVALGPSCPR